MLLIATGMGFGLVDLRYLAVSGTTEEDAEIASSVQCSADQPGGATGTAEYVGVGFALSMHAGGPLLVAAGLAIAGLVPTAAIIARVPAPAKAAE